MHHPPATVVPAINVVLATCRRKPELTPGDALLRMELELRGATAVAKAWDAVSPAGTPALVCLRSTWDYHLRWPDFRHWVGGFADRPGVLWNPPETVLWNGTRSTCGSWPPPASLSRRPIGSTPASAPTAMRCSGSGACRGRS